MLCAQTHEPGLVSAPVNSLLKDCLARENIFVAFILSSLAWTNYITFIYGFLEI
jgi:hypothetical protein